MAQSEADQLWEHLPDNIILRVFSLLEEIDLVHASSTCSLWRRWFHEPRFWRSLTLDFNTMSVPNRDLLQKLNHHLCLIGPWVEHVTIVCPQKRLIVHTHLDECVKVILDTLALVNKTIRTFKIFQSFLGVNELRLVKLCKEYNFSECNVINAMVHFIESQTCLHTLVISEALLPTIFGHMLMSSLARSPSVDTLQQLDISYMYAFRLQRNQHGALVRSTLRKCQSLKEITLNHSTLEGIDFIKLFEAMKHSLRLLRIKDLLRDKQRDANLGHHTYSYFEYQSQDDNVAINYIGEFDRGEGGINVQQGVAVGEDENDIQILDEENPWREFTRRYPELRMALDFDGVIDVTLSHLTSGMPISSIILSDIESPEYGGSDVDMDKILNHLSMCSWQTLESATFIGHFCEDIDQRRRETRVEEVVNFITRHVNIKSVKFSADLMNHDLLENVKSELVTRYHESGDVLSIL